MATKIFSVTYASYGDVDGELFTETKVFLNEEVARAYQQSNIISIIDDSGRSDVLNYEDYKDDDNFSDEGDTWSYITKLEVHEC